jgi:cytochrome c5
VKPTLWLLALALSGGIMSCSMVNPDLGNMATDDRNAVGGISEVPNPSQEMAAKSKTPLKTLQRGHEVYMLNCGQCHEYKLPEKIDIEDWEDAMPKMIGHAGLERADEKAVLEYVKAVKVVKGV